MQLVREQERLVLEHARLIQEKAHVVVRQVQEGRVDAGQHE
jgi:hypothetical protein